MRKNKLPNFVVISIFTLITAIMWVSLNIFRVLIIKPPPVVPEEISNPLNPTLKTELLEKINNRLLIDVSQIPETVVSQTPPPAPNLDETPVQSPTPIGQPNESTESGNSQEPSL